MTIGCIAVSNEVVGRFVPREGIGDLAGDPLRRWIGRYPERYQPPAFVLENDRDVEQPEAHRWHDQEVHDGDARHMVAEKGLPGLRPSSPLYAMYLATVD